AVDRLADSGEENAVRERHARFFAAAAEAVQPALESDPGALDRVAADHDNYRTALERLIATGDADRGLRLGFGLWRFWQRRGHLAEGRRWFERLLAIPGAEARTAARAKGLTGAAGIAYWQNDYGATLAWYAEAEAI